VRFTVGYTGRLQSVLSCIKVPIPANFYEKPDIIKS
jgi:hypothetical protein